MLSHAIVLLGSETWNLIQGNTKGGSIIVPMNSCLTDLDESVFENKNKNCQFLYSWFQTSQTGGQCQSYTSPFSIIPCLISS